MGYNEYKIAGRSKSLPRMMGWQGRGRRPIVKGHVVTSPETVATAIRDRTQRAGNMVKASEESSGAIDTVSDDEILGCP